MKKTLIFFALFAFSASLALASPDSTQSSSIIKGVTNVLYAQRDAWNRGDLKGFMDGYWHSTAVTFVSDGTIHEGWDAVYLRYVKTYGNDKASMGYLAFSRIVVIPLGDKAALCYGRWDLIQPHGKSLGGIFSLVFRKFSDGWKIIHDHTSRDEQKK